MKPIRQPRPAPVLAPSAEQQPLQNDTPERKGPSAEQRVEREKAALRELLQVEGLMGLYYRLYPLEAPAGYFARDEGRDRSRGRER